MRELKFRVWDKVKNEWFPIKNAMALLLNNDNKENLVFITKNGPYPIPQTDQDSGGRNRFVIQQFTGLLDKNGVEIYEGDIVECNDGIGGRMHGEVVYDSEYAAFRVVFTDILQWTFYKVENAEIIGNIFENPELK